MMNQEPSSRVSRISVHKATLVRSWSGERSMSNSLRINLIFPEASACLRQAATSEWRLAPAKRYITLTHGTSDGGALQLGVVGAAESTTAAPVFCQEPFFCLCSIAL